MPVLIFFLIQIAQASSLEEMSLTVNKDLPETYDHATKLMRTTVENGGFVYHFIVGADKGQYAFAVPKVRAQVMSTICKHSREKIILEKHKANVVYRYENERGQSLGEFMIPAGHCGR